ncbi:AMP-binding protein, partial [Dietzia sp. UBA5065]
MHTIPEQYLRSSHAPSPRTLIDVLGAAAERHPDAPCLDDGERVLSYGQVWDQIHVSARWMHAQGVGAGDRVGILMPSGTVDLYLAILATLAAGAAYVPVDVDDPAERADLVFGQAQVAAVYTADGMRVTDPDRPADPARHRGP